LVSGPVALLSSASYQILVHRLTVYAPRLPFPLSVALKQLRLRFARRDQLATGLAPVGIGGTQEHECQRYFKLEMAFGTTSNTADKSFRDASTTLRTTLGVANFMARPSIRARRCAGNVAMMSSSFFAIFEVLRKS